ncbi:MAG TPA: prepilin-type N-terminal cleavage/methylation domain-containing protein [Luteibacter sp.]|nr:prepilin-type N-terminal cleavage/methylation domain-containing protein [Luteibacter sp.]
MHGYRARGFSLLEVIAAIALLAICFGSLMRVTSASLNLTSRASAYTRSAMWANSMLDRVFVVDFPGEGTSRGRFDDSYQWTMRVSSPSDTLAQQTNVPLHLYRIDLDVTWREGTHDVSSHFTTLRTVSTHPVAQALLPVQE